LEVGAGESSKVVRLPRHPVEVSDIISRFEMTFGRTAFAHLFVTNAMAEFLTKEWDLQSVVQR
jgi:beta-1,4-mannosyltransferase